MIQSYNELLELVEAGVITNVNAGSINSASIDVHLGHGILREVNTPGSVSYVHLDRRESVNYRKEVYRRMDSIPVLPGEFILANTLEQFFLPNDISAHFILKSSIARNGLNQMAAVWCDAGWSGSTLTLELRNETRFHTLMLQPGIPIGQMVFHRHTLVPDEKSYRVRGRYNNDSGVSAIKP